MKIYWEFVRAGNGGGEVEVVSFGEGRLGESSARYKRIVRVMKERLAILWVHHERNAERTIACLLGWGN